MQTKWPIVICLLLSLVFLLIVRSFAAEAEKGGKLESLESEINTPDDSQSQTTSSRHLSSEQSEREGEAPTALPLEGAARAPIIDAKEIAAQSIVELLMSFFMMGLVQTGSENFPELYKELKSEWHPALPTIRIEPAYQWIAGDVNGFSGKLEAGYLILGVDGEFTRYFEKSPNQSLDVWQTHFLLRTIFTKHFQTNLALGAKFLRGERNNTGFDFGIPFYIYPSTHFIFDVQPYLARVSNKNIYDIGAGLAYKYKLIGIRAGYRAIFVGDERLHGPRIGLFLQY